MKHKIILNIERLPGGGFLATAPDIIGPVARGRTYTETLDIACDVSLKIFELRGLKITDEDFEISVNSSVRKC